MDILKKLMNNPGFHHIAETIIGYMDKEVAYNLVGNCALLSDKEQKFLMKTLRRRMVHEAQLICGKTYSFHIYDHGMIKLEKSIYQMFPFFANALQELRTSEEFVSFKLLYEILLLLEDVVNDETCPYSRYSDGFKLTCLYRFIDPDEEIFQDVKGPRDVIKVLKEGQEEAITLYDMFGMRNQRKRI